MHYYADENGDDEDWDVVDQVDDGENVAAPEDWDTHRSRWQ